jgi:N-acetylmuramoyl-L-alanine amidase
MGLRDRPRAPESELSPSTAVTTWTTEAMQSAATDEIGRVGYVVSRQGAELAAARNEPGVPIEAGVTFAVLAADDAGFKVLDACNREGWLRADHVESGSVPMDRERRFDRSVFVIDPGHGHPDLGAVGPHGLTETEINLEVSERLGTLLRSSQNIDWETGAVTSGNMVPAAAAVVFTRTPEGPNNGDYEAGLTYRAALGNSVDATALVSIHHNSAPTVRLDHPGAEAYVSASNAESARLGGLIVEELRAGLSIFDADWMGAPGAGVISRISADGGDYYTVLEQSDGPAVIVEGAYISNPSEEALATTDQFQQAYAEGVYRALVRFVTTNDDPISAPQPETWQAGGHGRSMDHCAIPSP